MAVELTIKNNTFIVPESKDHCELWLSYFKQLKDKVGKENAKMLWLITWQSNGSTSCTTNPDFNTFLKKNGLNVSNASTRAIADFSSIGENLFGLGKNLTKIVSIGVPVTLGVVLFALLVMVVKTAKNSDALEVVKVATPVGRATTLMQ